MHSQDSPIFVGPGETNFVSTQPTRVSGIPKCAESSGSGRSGVVDTRAGPGMLLVRTGGRKTSLPWV